ESVVMLIDGFLTVTAVLEPHRLFLPAAPPVSDSPAPPSVLAGDALLPAGVGKTLYHPETLVAHSTGNRNEQTSYCKPTTCKEKEIPLTLIV
ncbi:hypothetical protein XENOCAPTIV_030355, partial [Xenoophorus captivus]